MSPVEQDTVHEVHFHRFTDGNFPPITGLTPRMQYRIPKTHAWQMLPDCGKYDVIIWLDGSITFKRSDCVAYYLSQLADNDMAFWKHPVRRNIKQEVEHIEKHLRLGKPYITNRYKNGLHRECLDEIQKDETYKDRTLYASTSFIYRNTLKVQKALKDWWYWQSRFYSCDQIPLPYVLWLNDIKVGVMNEPLFKSGYISLVSKHK